MFPQGSSGRQVVTICQGGEIVTLANNFSLYITKGVRPDLYVNCNKYKALPCMFWENEYIVVGGSSNSIHGFHNLPDTLKKKYVGLRTFEFFFFFFFEDLGLNGLPHIPGKSHFSTLKRLKSRVQTRLWVSEWLLEGTRTKILLFFSL